LKIETQHFIECIRNGQMPLTSGWDGLNIVQILEAANNSLSKSGSSIQLKMFKPVQMKNVA
jgi:hypothetical protein